MNVLRNSRWSIFAFSIVAVIAVTACGKKSKSDEPKSELQLESEKLQGDWASLDEDTSSFTGGKCAQVTSFRNGKFIFIQACRFDKTEGNIEAGTSYVNVDRIASFEVNEAGKLRIKTDMSCSLEPEISKPAPDGDIAYSLQGDALTLGGMYSGFVLNKSTEHGTVETGPDAKEKYGCLGKGSDGKLLFIEKEKFKTELAKYN